VVFPARTSNFTWSDQERSSSIRNRSFQLVICEKSSCGTLADPWGSSHHNLWENLCNVFLPKEKSVRLSLVVYSGAPLGIVINVFGSYFWERWMSFGELN